MIRAPAMVGWATKAMSGFSFTSVWNCASPAIKGAISTVSRPQERHSDAPGGHNAIAVAQRHDQTLEVYLVDQAHGLPDDTGVEQRQKGRGRLEPSGRVVVACGHDDPEVGYPTPCVGQEKIELGLGCRRRVAAVEHVTRNQQRVDLLRSQRVEQPGEKLRVLIAAIELVQCLSQVPVRGVKNSHGLLFEVSAEVPLVHADQRSRFSATRYQYSGTEISKHESAPSHPRLCCKSSPQPPLCLRFAPRPERESITSILFLCFCV